MGIIKDYDSTDEENSLVMFDWKEDPNGWIQWKGTQVCIDIHCDCGEMSHFDGCFMYFIECPYCGRIYEANGHIQLVERDPKELTDCQHTIKLGEGDIHPNNRPRAEDFITGSTSTSWSWGDL